MPPTHGVSIEQDSHFTNKEEVLLKTTKFPSVFGNRVDMSKVNVSVMRPWIATRVEQMMGFEDDILVELVMSLLEAEQHPDPRKMQISLMGFLEKRAAPFMNELWRLLLSAQESIGGVPRAFVEQKKREMQEMREENAHIVEEVRRRQPPSDADARGAPPRQARRWDRGRAPIDRDMPRGSWRREGRFNTRERDAGWGSRARFQRERDEFGRDARRDASPEYSPPPPP